MVSSLWYKISKCEWTLLCCNELFVCGAWRLTGRSEAHSLKKYEELFIFRICLTDWLLDPMCQSVSMKATSFTQCIGHLCGSGPRARSRFLIYKSGSERFWTHCVALVVDWVFPVCDFRPSQCVSWLGYGKRFFSHLTVGYILRVLSDWGPGLCF
jgi:hypothetical protein